MEAGLTPMRMEQRDSSDMIQHYWLAIVGTQRRIGLPHYHLTEVLSVWKNRSKSSAFASMMIFFAIVVGEIARGGELCWWKGARLNNGKDIFAKRA